MDNNEIYLFLTEHHFHIICVTTMESQLCTGRDHSSSVHAELDKSKQKNYNKDLHLPTHTHNAGYLIHVYRNVNVPSVYYNPGVFSNDEYLLILILY